MEGWVPDSIKYVPGRRLFHVSAVVALVATSVPNDCTRGTCAGGVDMVVGSTVGQVTP